MDKVTFRGLSQLEEYGIFFCDRFSWRRCIPFVGLFWLPVLAFSKCQRGSFLRACLLTQPMGWLGEAFTGAASQRRPEPDPG